ncbi:DUF481 domain-containing protein [Terriglobus roseus]|nr:DUF481 domain-containing protein [Terriglobus roseus]
MGNKMFFGDEVLRRSVVCAVFLAVLSGGTTMAVAQATTEAPPPAKDVLVFTNGDQLSGTLQRSAGDNVVFKSDMTGEITVPLSKIKELRTQGAFAVLKHNDPVAVSQKVVPGKIVMNGTDVSVVTNDGNTGASVPVKDVAYLIDAQTFERDLAHTVSPWQGWGGTVNLGTTFSQSTIHGGSLAGGFSLIRQVPVLTFFRARNKTILNFQENYGVLTTPAALAGTTTDAQSKTSIMHADAERDEYFTKTFYVLAATSFDHNYSQSMDLQQIYGGGFGWTAFNTAVQQLDLKADVHYEKQQFFDRSINQNLIGSTFTESYRRTLPLKMTFTEQAAILPAWNNLNAYSANGTTTLLAPVFRRLGMNVTATDSFINNPTSGYQKNSFTFSTGLTYSLR